jgi:cellulose synthase/poly-beta-1,6-N-acetylglucosamine synthase-like glycosyltransferase
MFTFFLYVSFFITAILFFYGGSLLTFVLKYGRKKKLNKQNFSDFKGSVDILIPCHNEGEEVLETLQSLSQQFFLGKKNVYLLVDNLSDTSISFIQNTYQWEKDQILVLENNTFVFVVLVGMKGKREKLNYILPRVESDYIALLDADHLASRSWISNSLAMLENTSDDVCGVQSKREPKSLKNFFQIWDSAQNHIGNELLNISLNNAHQSVFFTGTTAVFKRCTFDEQSIPDSITEDTYLSYDVMIQNKKILYNENTGSYESVSPTLGDYMARRRRWSNGHNQSFIDHIRNFLSNKKSTWSQKLILIMHGVFYLMPVAAVVMVNIFQGYIFSQYPNWLQFIVFICALFVTFLTTYFLGRGYGRFFQDSFLSFFVIFPLVIAVSLLAIKFLPFEFYNYIISFPYVDDLFGHIQIVLFFIPLLILLYGSWRVRLFSFWQKIVLVISYPIIIFFDIYAIFLGFFDYLLGIKIWRIINRKTRHKISRTQLLLLLIITLLVFGIYGFMKIPKNNCHENSDTVFADIYEWLQPETLVWNSDYRQYINVNGDGLVTEFFGNFEYDSNNIAKIHNLDVTFQDTTETVSVNTGDSYTYTLDLPFGFDVHRIVFGNTHNACTRRIDINNTYKEVRGSKIYINNEPFLVKGVAPNFLQPEVDVSMNDGISQIQSLGANLVRSYHIPENSFIDALSEKNILFIPQPALSNWDNNDFFIKGTKGLYGRYLGMHAQFISHPFMFALNLGNELELKNRDNISRIEKILTQIKNKELSSLSMYSTFSPYINYSGDILGVNMLDTGKVYWKQAIPLLSQFKSPFVATELGGFAAYYEDIDPRLRSLRLKKQWDELESLGGSGAILFQSHDNWAQPVATGYNNPFAPEQPDDLRGIWDRENNEKNIADTVRSIFSDIQIQYLSEDIYSEEIITIRLSNIRSYELEDITLYRDDILYTRIGDLEKEKSIDVDISHTDFDTSSFEFRYLTHKGIKQIQHLHTPILVPEPLPFIEDLSDRFITKLTVKTLEADIVDTDINVHVPNEWLLENKHLSQGSRKDITSLDYYHDIESLVVNESSILVSELDQYVSGQGKYLLEFDFKKPIKKDSLLILEGIGNTSVELRFNNITKIINVHPYRENIIQLSKYLEKDYVGIFTLDFVRSNIVYLSAQDSPLAQDVIIDFQPPRLFQPQQLIVRKK